MKNKSTPLTRRLYAELLHAEYVEVNPRWKATNTAVPFTRIYMITEGSGYLHFGTTELTLIPGNIYVIPSGVKCSYGCEKSLSKTYFHISVPLPTGYDLMEHLDRCLVFSDSNAVKEMTACITDNSAASLIRVQCFIYDTIYKCIANMNNLEIREFSEYVTEIIRYIDINISADLSLSKISEALSTSSEKLRKTFCSETGMSIGKYIDNRVMHKAELMVREGRYSIKEISDILGFCDQFYFSRCFTRKFGISPRTYRKENYSTQEAE